MKSFYEFVQGNGAENPTIPVGQEQPFNSSPITVQHDDAAFESLENNLRKLVNSALKNKKINPTKLTELFAELSSQIANSTGQTPGANYQLGMKTNTELSTPLTQPTAS